MIDSAAPNQALRVALERLLNDTAAVDISPQIDLVRQLRKKYPHAIEVVQLALDDDPLTYDYGCFEFAFGLNSHPIGVRLRRIDYSERRVYILREYVYWIRGNDLITECPIDEVGEGDVVLYFDGQHVRHAGLARGGRVVSKWGQGHLWQHGLWEVPTSYGGKVLAYAAWETSRAAEAFQRFMEEQHQVLWAVTTIKLP